MVPNFLGGFFAMTAHDYQSRCYEFVLETVCNFVSAATNEHSPSEPTIEEIKFSFYSYSPSSF